MNASVDQFGDQTIFTYQIFDEPTGVLDAKYRPCGADLFILLLYAEVLTADLTLQPPLAFKIDIRTDAGENH